MSCVIVIPIYKDAPSRVESASIRQTFHILGKHDIVFITHQGCLLDEYQKIVASEEGVMRTEFFDKGYFDSTAHYSDLCFSEDFYLRFCEYEYMLICQPDAWVFRDELDYWCNQGYDFIGAPIFFPYNPKKFTRIFYGVGNGGFCLRRIEHCLNVIRSDWHTTFLKPSMLAKIYWYAFLYNEEYKNNILKRLGLLPLFLLKVFGFRNTIAQFRKTGCEEDMIFSVWAKNAWGQTCRVPDEKMAARFSLEVNPEYLYNKVGKQLPFGCHAFEKWEYESFWKKHIKID
ncbi:MAG: hypothetical protein II279_07285 [Bacteroidaceae bacterium]|nr:hypothetical protein [Bacteroidaceae bacterium]